MKLRVDLRDIPVEKLNAAVAAFGESVNFLMTAWQWSAWRPPGNKSAISTRIMVMVPDFLYYARLISTGQAAEIPRLPGSIASIIRSGFASIPTGLVELPGLVRGDFWAGAKALLAYDLGLIDSSFKGNIVLHSNLSDFAWFFEKQTFLRSFRNKVSSRSGWGISTQRLQSALSCCARWHCIPELVVFTPGTTRPETLVVETARLHQFASTIWVLDLTQWPLEQLCGAEIRGIHRDFDNEWLLAAPTAMAVCETFV